ncbi:MAG: cbb3-type cytochrome c oxidase subunit 3 [Pseudomonadota bacterium]
MDTYSLFRQFADSWALLAMFLFFIGVVVWVFRPGASQSYRDTAHIPLRDERPGPRESRTDADSKTTETT